MKQQNDDRNDDVELLLDAERPRHQKRIEFRRRSEVVDPAPELDIRDREDRRDGAASERLQFGWRQQDQGKDARRQEHGEQGRKDSPRATCVKIAEMKVAIPDFAENDRADEIARYDEEDVDADETARQKRRIGMKQDDRRDRNRTKSVNIRPILQEMPLARRMLHSTTIL